VEISLDAKVNKQQLNWTELGFQYHRTDYRFCAQYSSGSWNRGEMIASEVIQVHEGAPALHYAQQCFEGMKAQTAADGRVLLFRPDLNSERMNMAASRLLMPEVPRKMFIDAVQETVRANYSWIPPYGSGASLYIRPMLIGVGENLGLRPAQQFEFRVFVSPVGPYYKSDGLGVISLAVSEIDRAAPNGTGCYKVGANYAGGLLATRKAQDKGAHEALYLDSAEGRYIDEAGSANIVIAMKDGSFITPNSHAILPSITRKSLMVIAREQLHLKTEARPIDLRLEISQFEEAAACGTAAVLAPVGRILVDQQWHAIYKDGQTVGPIMQELYDRLVGIQMGELRDAFDWCHEVKF
jgi:branched-chain amino acid aminotransferase